MTGFGRIRQAARYFAGRLSERKEPLDVTYGIWKRLWRWHREWDLNPRTVSRLQSLGHPDLGWWFLFRQNHQTADRPAFNGEHI